ncbi:LOB domain-containing protein 18-like [Salvia divinorum]|uniref:LOB domain-containing protein 18-like n=1 Tax=Salvia divinorum TaxID=28513 RepID=A0ABD1H137_SALDI
MSSGNVPGSGTGGGGGPCGACKFLRRKCVAGCVFAPYFDSEQGAAHFAAVHKVFGASNVSKLLLHIPPNKRLDTVITICYEAQSRLRDPIYGCVAHIFNLQQQVVNLQQELSYLQAHLAAMELPTPPPLQPQQILVPVSQAILDLPPIPAAYDLSAVCGDVVAPQSAWSVYPRQQIEQRQFSNNATPAAVGVGGGCDLQELARELLNRHAPPIVGCMNQASSLPPNSS